MDIIIVKASVWNSDKCYKFLQPFSCCRLWLQSWGSVPSAPCNRTFPSRGRTSSAAIVRRSWPSSCTLLLISWSLTTSLSSRRRTSSRPTRNVALALCFRFRVSGVLTFLILDDGFPLKVWGVICSTCSPLAHAVLCSLGWFSLIAFVTFEAKGVATVFSSWSQAGEWPKGWQGRSGRWCCMTSDWRCPFGLITSRIQKEQRIA